MKTPHFAFYFVLFNFFSHTSWAAVECSHKGLSKKAIYTLPGSGYWMQVGGDCRMTYTSVGGVESKMYNLCQRKVEDITKHYDAFALPEGDLYVHPLNGISFYKMSDAIKRGAKAQPFYTDPNHVGVYQSIGLLKGSTRINRTVRIAMGTTNGAIRDYNVVKKGEDDYTIAPVQKAVIPICKNLGGGNGLDAQIPILSRNGEMIAARQYGSNITEVFKIKLPSGDCESIAKTPSSTSKVSFSFDNRNIFYVAQDPKSGFGRLMKLDILNGKTRTLSGPDEDVLYVTTKEDGSIFYSRRNGSGTMPNTGGDEPNSDLVELAPFTVADPGNQKPYEALGLLWGSACGQQLDLDYALAVGQRMSRDVCRSVVTDQNFSSLSQEYKELSLDRLKTECELKKLTYTSEGSTKKSKSGVK